MTIYYVVLSDEANFYYCKLVNACLDKKHISSFEEDLEPLFEKFLIMGKT